MEDVLSRRTRALILDASGSVEVVPRQMARELNKNAAWEADQVRAYEQLALNYRVDHLSD